MSDVKGLAVQAVALSVLASRVKARTDDVKARLAAALDPGDRKTATLDDGSVVGSISYARGKTSARVTDPNALADWVADAYPDEVVPQVRPAFLSALLEASKRAGVPMTPDGTLDVPGITVGTSEPYLSVRPDEMGLPALEEAIRANQLLALDKQ